MGKLCVELIGTLCKCECGIEIKPNVKQGSTDSYNQKESVVCFGGLFVFVYFLNDNREIDY